VPAETETVELTLFLLVLGMREHETEMKNAVLTSACLGGCVKQRSNSVGSQAESEHIWAGSWGAVGSVPSALYQTLSHRIRNSAKYLALSCGWIYWYEVKGR
jgi:hypothetical protein